MLGEEKILIMFKINCDRYFFAVTPMQGSKDSKTHGGQSVE